MPVVKTQSIILHSFPYGDTSKILRLLTPEFGVRSVIAKGARSARSRFGGLIEPFTEGEAQFNLREGRELFTLTSFALSRSRQAVGRDLTAFTGASLLAELTLRAGTEEPDPALFNLVREALDELAAPVRSTEATALAAIWRLIGLVGFQPELTRCIQCGRELGTEEASGFDPAAGGAACRRCRPSGRLLPADVRREIIRFGAGERIEIGPESARVHGALLSAFLPAHISADAGLRSLALFRDLLG